MNAACQTGSSSGSGTGQGPCAPAQAIAKKPYQFLLVNVLREYLTLEFAVNTPFPLDVERIFDDFGAHHAVFGFCVRLAQSQCLRLRAGPGQVLPFSA